MSVRTTTSEVPCRGGSVLPSVSCTRPRRASRTTFLSSRHEVGRDILFTDLQLLLGCLEKTIPEGCILFLRECQVFTQAQASKDRVSAHTRHNDELGSSALNRGTPLRK